MLHRTPWPGLQMQSNRLNRREFIALVGGVAAAWPLAARAQQPERSRRIGVLMNLASDDAEGQARLAAFHQGLQQLGWTVGRNVQIDYRWGAGDADRIRKFAAELIVLAPDVILSAGRQYHRLRFIRIQHQRKMASAA